jgi:hypothetical protein
MSNELHREQHSKRLHQKERHIARQMSIRKAHSFPLDEAHKYHKVSGTTCGDSNCVMCGNPRKFFGERTIQERRFDQDVVNVPFIIDNKDDYDRIRSDLNLAV